MGRLVNRVEDGNAFEGCHERMCAGVDHCHVADAFCGCTRLVFFTDLTGPGLQKNQPLVCIKACLRLIWFVFSSSVGQAEFQRQVVLPNISKFSQALIEVSGKYENEKLRVGIVLYVVRLPIGLLIQFPGSVLRDPHPVGLTFPLLPQTTPRAFVCSLPQTPKRLIPRSDFGKTGCCFLETVFRPALYWWESGCLEFMEKIRRRNFGVHT